MPEESAKKDEDNLSTRVPTLEAKYDRLHEDVTDLRTGLRQVAEEMRDGFREVLKTGKTNWSSYASWAAIVLGLVGMLGSGYVRDLDRVEDILKTLTTKVVDHQETIGHHGMVEKVEMMEKQLNKLADHARENELKAAEHYGYQKAMNRLTEKMLFEREHKKRK